jgi:hypothetical protein
MAARVIRPGPAGEGLIKAGMRWLLGFAELKSPACRPPFLSAMLTDMAKPLFMIGASLPRSGHHYLEAQLRALLGDDLAYCRSHLNQCCGEVICARPPDRRWFLRKSHAPRLDLAADLDGVLYVIQHRPPRGRMLSLVDFQMARRADFAIEDAAFAARWLAKEAIYSIGFGRKWLTRPPVNAVVINYDDLSGFPHRVVSALLSRMGYECSDERLQSSIDRTSTMRANVRVPEPYRRRDEGVSPLAPGLLAEYDALVRSELPDLWGVPPVAVEPGPVREVYDRIRATQQA